MQSLGKHFQSLAKTALAKHGFAQGDLLSHWSDIVGEPAGLYARPERIKWPRDKEASGGTLVLTAAPGRALDVQYASPVILQRINQFFGYQAIAAIKIIQSAKPLHSQPKITLKPVPTAALMQQLEAIADPALKAALTSLGASLPRSPQAK
jgi:hypothetical protein